MNVTMSESAGGFVSRRAQRRLVDRLRDRGICSETVLAAIASVPRHQFLEEALQSRAYEDTALPIGYQQTISQPYIVALMTECLLNGRPRLRTALEIGTGCGYQAAVLSQVVDRVFTVERIAPLARRAQTTLAELGIHNVAVRHADGKEGWSAKRPFDGIMLTAAPDSVPQALFSQLRDGGVLVAPEGDTGAQRLSSWVLKDGKTQKQFIADVSFVPMLSGVKS